MLPVDRGPPVPYRVHFSAGLTCDRGRVPPERAIRGRGRERGAHSGREPQSLYNLTLEVPGVTPAIPYSSEASFPVQPAFKARGLHKGVKIRRLVILGASYCNVRCTHLRKWEFKDISEGKERPPWRCFQLRLNSVGIALSSCEVIWIE